MYRIYTLKAETPPAQLVEDLREHLEHQGYELLCGSDVDDIVETVKNRQPDLVLMDPKLQDSMARQACRRLKENPETEIIPVIFLQESARPEERVLDSFESGANDVIRLDQPFEEILARMQAAIRAKQVATQSIKLADQLSKMNAELYERNLQVEKELYVTRQLQQSLLPPFLPDDDAAESPTGLSRFTKCHYRDERLRITGVYLPCDALGGDLYDVIKFANGTVGVSVADVSGHGVPAGFITAIFKSTLYRITHGYTAPNDIMYQLNNQLADIIKTGEYVTTVYLRLEPQPDEAPGMHMSFSGAGHPYPMYFNGAEGSVSRLQENGTPLVWVKNMDYPIGHVDLAPGDRVLLFTDGVSEMRNAQGELYGEDRLQAAFQKLVQSGSRYVLDELIQELSDFTEGHPLEDDLSVVLIEVV